MLELYSGTEYQKLKKRKNLSLAFSIISFSLIAIVTTVSFFLVKKDTLTIYEPITIALDLFFGFIALFILFFEFRPLCQREKQYSLLTSNKESEVEGTVHIVSKELTLLFGISATEIEIKGQNGTISCYWDHYYGPFPAAEGDKVKGKIAGGRFFSAIEKEKRPIQKKKHWGEVYRHWYLFAIWTLLVSTILPWGFSFFNEYKANEKVTVFLASYGYSSEKCQTILDADKPQSLKAIEVSYYDLSDTYFDVKYEAFGKGDCDITILPFSKIKDTSVMSSYFSFEEEKITSCFGPNTTFYSVNGKDYGVKIHSKENSDNLVKYSGSVQEDYYLFFSKSSVHIGADETDEAAFEVGKVFQKL